jgi:hypothetical protein
MNGGSAVHDLLDLIAEIWVEQDLAEAKSKLRLSISPESASALEPPADPSVDSSPL